MATQSRRPLGMRAFVRYVVEYVLDERRVPRMRDPMANDAVPVMPRLVAA